MSIQLFNPDRKNRFLEEKYPNLLTRETYKSLLNQVSIFEADKNKDLCDFTYAEATELLIGLSKKTYNSLAVAQTIITKYVDWCLENGYSKLGTNINNFKVFSKEDLQKYTSQIAMQYSYIDREKVYKFCMGLYNWIDQALLVLPFEGVRGRSERENSFEELKNLKANDLFPDENVIRVTRNNGETNRITVDPRTMDILVKASKEMEYHKKNGEAKGKLAIMNLKETPYILRTLNRNNDIDDDRISTSSINNRFINIRSYTGISFLNPTLLFQSGLLEKCSILEQERGELDTEDIRQIFTNLKIDERGWFNLKELYIQFKKNSKT